MKYLYFSMLGLVIVGGLGVCIYFGLSPKPIPKIKASQIDSPERLGSAIAQRLWFEIKDSPLVFVGVDPEQVDELRVWKGFLDSLPQELRFQQILVEPRLANKQILPATGEIDINNNLVGFAEGAQRAAEAHVRVLVVMPSIYSSQTIADNPADRLKRVHGIQALSLSVVRATLRREEEATAAYPCATGGGDTAGLGSWGCLIQNKSRSLYRKKWEQGKYVGLMDQVGASDFLILLRYVDDASNHSIQ